MKKRLMSLILCLALMVSLLPARAAAEDDYHDADGKINVIELTGIGTPLLYCGGAMLPSYASVSPVSAENELDSTVIVTWMKEEAAVDEEEESEDSEGERSFEVTEDSTFEAEAVYGVQIRVRAAEGAAFAEKTELKAALFSDRTQGESGRIPTRQVQILSASSQSVTLLVNFGAAGAEKTIIPRIDIVGVTDPVNGASAAVPEGYEESEPTYKVEFDSAWADSEGTMLSADDVFSEASDYSLGFTVTAGEEYMFAPKTAVFINGKRITNGLPLTGSTQQIGGVYEKQSDINNTVLTLDAESYSDEATAEIGILAVLKDKDGQLMKGRTVVLMLDGTVLAALHTDEQGCAAYSFLPEADAYRVGNYELTAMYAGEPGYEVAETSAALVIRGEEEEMPKVVFELSEDESFGTLIGVDAEMKYSFDGEAFTDIEADMLEGAEQDRVTVPVPEEAEQLYVVRKGSGKLTVDSKAQAISIVRAEPESSSETESQTETKPSETTKKETTAPATTKETTAAPTTKATTAVPVPVTQVITVSAQPTQAPHTSIPATTIPANIVSEDTETVDESTEETPEEATTSTTASPTVKEVSTTAEETSAYNDDDDMRKNAVRLIVIIAVIFVVICILIAVLFYLNEQKGGKSHGEKPKEK